MPDPIPDPLATYLDEVRKRAALTKPSAHGYTPRGEQLPGGPADDWLIANLEAAADVPRLLAAVEAVLKLADEWKATSVQLGEMAERAAGRGADPLRTTLMDARAQAHQDNAQALREAISRALLGEGSTNAH